MQDSEENSKSEKVTNQMAKSKAQTHQTNGLQLSYSRLWTCIFICTKWWIKPGFIVAKYLTNPYPGVCWETVY